MEYYSHIGQDKWVAEVFRHLRGGYFLDFGAFDGITTSNTFVLEKQLGWTGICVEPNPRYYLDVCRLRNCITVNNALWTTSRQSLEFHDAHGLSSFTSFAGDDLHSDFRRKSPVIHVDTIHPNELLRRFEAPKYIHYMSLDTEGCEAEILEAIDLDEYKIALASIEHNHDEKKRDHVRAFLSRRGYDVVQNKNDDFFFHKGHLKKLTRHTAEGYADPQRAAEMVRDTYKIKDAVCNY